MWNCFGVISPQYHCTHFIACYHMYKTEKNIRRKMKRGQNVVLFNFLPLLVASIVSGYRTKIFRSLRNTKISTVCNKSVWQREPIAGRKLNQKDQYVFAKFSQDVDSNSPVDFYWRIENFAFHRLVNIFVWCPLTCSKNPHKYEKIEQK